MLAKRAKRTTGRSRSGRLHVVASLILTLTKRSRRNEDDYQPCLLSTILRCTFAYHDSPALPQPGGPRPRRGRTGVSPRRNAVRVAGETVPAAGGLSGLPALAPKARRVIYLFQSGAPSQMDLFDPKPKLAALTALTCRIHPPGTAVDRNDRDAGQVFLCATVFGFAARAQWRVAERIAAAHGARGG